jgi:hypothetical protein
MPGRRELEVDAGPDVNSGQELEVDGGQGLDCRQWQEVYGRQEVEVDGEQEWSRTWMAGRR